MLLLDFCNIQEWSVDKISDLYEKHQIIHTAVGKKHCKELFCSTKHKEKWRYYFTEKIPPILGDLDDKFCISPDRTEYAELWEMLEKSQNEYRKFLDECIDGRLNIEFLNKLSQGFNIRFLNNSANIFLAFHSFELLDISSIESYIELDVLNICLNRVGPWLKDLELIKINLKSGEESLLGRIRKCPNCNTYFIVAKRASKKFCNNQCRYGYHNREDIKSGKRKRFMRKKRKEGLYQ